jgi:hypothetical protein
MTVNVVLDDIVRTANEYGINTTTTPSKPVRMFCSSLQQPSWEIAT